MVESEEKNNSEKKNETKGKMILLKRCLSHRKEKIEMVNKKFTLFVVLTRL